MVITSSALDQFLDAPAAPTLLYSDPSLAMLALGFLSSALLNDQLGGGHRRYPRAGGPCFLAF
jgi:hypothetical protein